MTHFKRFIAVLFISFLANTLFGQVPTITAFTPASGVSGTTVVLTGTNFSTTPASNIVYFGAAKATVTASTATSCTVTVPPGTTYERITLSVGIRTGYSTKPFILTSNCPYDITTSAFDTTSQSTGTGSNPYYAVLGDFDQDGKSDLAFAFAATSNDVAFYRNTSTVGNPSFVLAQTRAAGTNPRGLAAGDLNGDGKLDVVTFNNETAPDFSVYQNTSTTGTVSFNTEVNFYACSYNTPGNGGVCIADLDADGKPEIISANGFGDSVTVLRNLNASAGATITTSTFASAVKFSVPGKPNWVNAADIDGDGKVDLVTSNESANTISVLRNTTVGSISFASPVSYATASAPNNFRIGDIDLDGKPDIAVANNSGAGMYIFRNTSTSGTVSFAAGVNFSTNTSSNPRDICITDLNGDGLPDVAVLCPGADKISVFENQSTPGTISSSSLAAKDDFFMETGTSPRALTAGDVDGDGKPDFITESQVADRAGIFRNLIQGGPVMTSAASKTICSGSSVSLALTATPSSGTTYSWIATNNAGTSGESTTSQTGSTITNTVTNNTYLSTNVIYTVTPSSSTCPGGVAQPQTVTITVDPKPAITAMTSTVCSGLTFTVSPVNVTNGTVPPGTTYSWSAPTVTGSMTGGASGTSATSITATLTNTTTTAQTATYTVTPVFGTCTGSTFTVTVTVNPKPVMTSTSAVTICSGTSLSIPLTSDIASTYSWIAGNNANTTGESTTAQSTSTINNTIVNSSTSAQIVTYTVTPTSTAGSCVGTAQTVTVTVNPQPIMTNATSVSVCSGAALSFALTSNIAASYSWLTTDNVNTTGESTTAQTGGMINNTITNALTTATTLIYTVTPTATSGSCVGAPQTVTVTVNPKPAMTSATSATTCSGIALSLAYTSNVSSTYSWLTTDNVNTTGESTTAQTGSTLNNTITNNAVTAQTLIYTVTPTSTGGLCAGTAQSVTITVNPKPAMTSASTATVCSGISVNHALSSSVASTYSWITTDNANTTGESTTAQTGSTITNTVTNNTTTAQTLIYTVTPTSGTGACVGAAQTVTVTVNPKPAMTSAATYSVCSGTTMAHALASNVASTYSWLTSTHASVTGESTTAQSGGTIDDALTNTSTTISQTLNYTVTPTSSSGSCVGNTQTIVVTLYPAVAMTNATTTSVCSGSAMAFALTSSVPSSYSWLTTDNVNASGESTTAQSGSTINNTITHALTTATTLVYTVTPTTTTGSCAGTVQTLTVTVNPKPVMTSASSTSVCSATALSFALTSGAGASYSWLTSDNVNTTGESTTAQSGSTINNTITNTLTTATTLIYTVTPTGTAGSCVGTAQTVTVTVNPKPIMTSASSTSVCSGIALNHTLTSGAGATYSWIATDNINTTGESTTSQTGSTINNTITSAITTPTTVLYTVTPTGTTGSCVGNAQTVTVTVNPKPTVSSASSKTICSGNSVALTLTSATASTFQWLATNNVNTTGESTTAQTGSTITNTLTSTSTSIQTVVYTVTPTGTSGSCVGTAQTVTVTLDNVPPPASAGTDVSLCSSSLNMSGNDPFPGSGTWTLTSQSIPTFTTTIYAPTTYNSLTGFANFLTGNNATLRWTVTSQLGVCPATFDEVVITKISCPLTSAFTTSANNLCIDPADSIAVVYTDNSVPGAFPPINTWTWTFNGGTPASATGQGPHTVYYHYAAAQTTYAASLTVVDNNSNQNTSTQIITVRPKPSAPGVISGPATVCQAQTGVSYSVASITNANSYSWVFPTGATSSNPNNIALTDFSSSAQSGVIKVAGVNTCGAGDTSYLSVTVNPLPGSAGVITGTSPVCQGQSGVAYSLGAVANASSYNWTFPTGGSTAGTTNSITAAFTTAAQSGLISVTGNNSCGTGAASTFSVTANPLPAAAGSITGSSTVCQGQSGVSFSINTLTNASSYTWTFPTGASSSGTTNTASVNFNSAAQSGMITVAGVNSCGTGTSSSFSITANPLPSAAGTISGPDSVCAGSNGAVFSVASITNASSYSWTFPAGAVSVNPNNLASADFSTNASSGLISVAGVNSCGSGTSTTFSVVVNPLPGSAGSISGTTPVCQGINGVAYSVAAIANADSYTWTFPPGISTTGTSNSITADFSTTAQSGTITVTGLNACGTGSTSSFNLITDPLPAAAGTLTGSSAVCQGQNGVSFSVGGIANASTYNWSFPTGATSSSTTNVSLVDFDFSAASGLISVEGVNACGTGPASSFSVTVNTLPLAAGTISGTSPVCAGSNSISFSIPAILNASAYTWSFPAGISSINPNNTALADLSTTAQSGIITAAGVNTCGTGPSSTFTITVDSLPEDATLITGVDTVCQGQTGVLYFVNPIANATTYNWSTPSGSTGSGTGTTHSIDFSNTASAGNISVYGQNACGNGNSSTITVAVNPLPDAPAFSGSITLPLCPFADSMLFSFSPATNALSYSWVLPVGAYANGSTTNDSISIGFTSANAVDTLKVLSVNACGSSAYSYMLLNLQALAAPSICMVTTDSSSVNNEILWDKTGFAASDTFLVYRDTANNNYALIGKVPFDSLSMFADTVRTLYAANGDPNVSSWRYKIAVMDSCGNMSAMSPYHQTMFFQNSSGNFSWNHYEIEGQITPVPVLSNYHFKRDDNGTGAWNTIQTLSASSTAYTDLNYALYQFTADWRVETQWTINCDPSLKVIVGTMAAVTKSRSNIQNNKLNLGVEEKAVHDFILYPNPAKDQLTIELRSEEKNICVELLDVSGRVVQNEKINAAGSIISINIQDLSNGIYFVRVTAAGLNMVKKLVIEK
jgi:hypothetical protein